MKENINFYKCSICGNIIELVEGDNTKITCCGKPVEHLMSNMVDASIEKHVPVYDKVEDEIVVRVGEVEHPMDKAHYIMWVAQVIGNRVTRVQLYPEQSTVTRFPYIKNSIIYAYCNIHGLWSTKVK